MVVDPRAVDLTCSQIAGEMNVHIPFLSPSLPSFLYVVWDPSPLDGAPIFQWIFPLQLT